MYLEATEPYRRVIIHSGEFFVSSKPVVISTILGSCVAACLYDPVNRIMGMNHFMLSGDSPPTNTPIGLTGAGRYGIHAMELLINEMMKQGANRNRLCAKVFGGSSIIGSSPWPAYSVGDDNIRFILEFLELENIELRARDLGGRQGRVIHFRYGDFTVYVRKIRQDHTAELAKQDRQYWLDSLKKRGEAASPVELWD